MTLSVMGFVYGLLLSLLQYGATVLPFLRSTVARVKQLTELSRVLAYRLFVALIRPPRSVVRSVPETLPTHVGLAVLENEIWLEQVAEVILSLAELGIFRVTVFDPSGAVKAHSSDLAQRLRDGRLFDSASGADKARIRECVSSSRDLAPKIMNHHYEGDTDSGIGDGEDSPVHALNGVSDERSKSEHKQNRSADFVTLAGFGLGLTVAGTEHVEPHIGGGGGQVLEVTTFESGDFEKMAVSAVKHFAKVKKAAEKHPSPENEPEEKDGLNSSLKERGNLRDFESLAGFEPPPSNHTPTRDELCDYFAKYHALVEPELIVIFGDATSLRNYPAWQLRIAELVRYSGGSINHFKRADMMEILDSYARRDRRLGR